MNRWWLWLWLAVLPLAAWSQSDDLTYKGVPLGASIAEYKRKLPDQHCTSKSCVYSQVDCLRKGDSGNMRAIDACDRRNSFGGVRLLDVEANFRDGRLVEVRFSIAARDFDALTDAVIERLGRPTKVIDRTGQTEGGATLQNREMIWERSRMYLTVERHTWRIDEGRAILTTPQELNRKLKEYEAERKKGAKDF